MNTTNMIWGIVSIVGMLIGFIPCIGALNWLVIPFAGVGIVLGIIGIVIEKESKTGSIAGLIMCIVAVCFGTVRLAIGGGLF